MVLNVEEESKTASHRTTYVAWNKTFLLASTQESRLCWPTLRRLKTSQKSRRIFWLAELTFHPCLQRSVTHLLSLSQSWSRFVALSYCERITNKSQCPGLLIRSRSGWWYCWYERRHFKFCAEFWKVQNEFCEVKVQSAMHRSLQYS